MSYPGETTVPVLPFHPEVNLQPGVSEQTSPVPPELAELAEQVDQVFEGGLRHSIGDIGTKHLLPTANTNTGGHQGGNSEFENTRQPSGGSQTNDRGSSTTSTDKSNNQKSK